MLSTAASRTLTRASLIAAVVAGTSLFGVLFALTFTSPDRIERAAQSFLRAEVEASARARFGDRADSTLTTLERTGALGAALAARADSMRRLAASDWPERIAAILDAVCCRQDADRADAVRQQLETSAAAADERLAILRTFVVGAYRARLHALLREMRFFTAMNALLFGLVGVMLYLRRADMRTVLLPSVLLMCSTIAAVYLYFATQDWFWTILLGDYMGAWYVVLVGLTAAFAADIVLLKGRVSLRLLGNLPAALVPPC